MTEMWEWVLWLQARQKSKATVDEFENEQPGKHCWPDTRLWSLAGRLTHRAHRRADAIASTLPHTVERQVSCPVVE